MIKMAMARNSSMTEAPASQEFLPVSAMAAKMQRSISIIPDIISFVDFIFTNSFLGVFSCPNLNIRCIAGQMETMSGCKKDGR